MTNTEPALALRFTVRVDGLEVGVFSQCDGLSAEYEVEEVREGGNNDFIHRYPGRAKYPNLKLTRAIDQDSAKIAAWFSACKGGTAKVEVRNGLDKVVATWSFRDTWPVKYTGPQLNATTNGVATETLEIAHHGFVMEGH